MLWENLFGYLRWAFKIIIYFCSIIRRNKTGRLVYSYLNWSMILFLLFLQDAKNKNIENILILSGDHLYRMDYMDFVQV